MNKASGGGRIPAELHQFLYTTDIIYFTYIYIVNAIRNYFYFHFRPSVVHSVQFNSVVQSCLNLCNPMNHSTPGLPIHHQFQEFTQTHVHQVGDAIQLSHPLLSPSPPAPNPSQHQGLFQ